MFTYRSRALLWVLLLIIILPMSAVASQEIEWQGAANGETKLDTPEANAALSEGDNPTASRNQSEELEEINDDDDGDNDDGDNDDGDNDDGDNDDGDNDDGDNDDGDNDDGDNDDGDDDDDGNSGPEIYGSIDSFPTGLIGNWVINGVTYVANANTRFRQEHGPFAVGACVEIDYYVSAGSNIATEIETENYSGSCQNNYSRVYGNMQSYPEGLIGNWVVNGVTYVADANTRFRQEHGLFAVGACVEVDYYVSGGSNIATEIETENDSGACQNNREQISGHLQSFPSELVGDWVVDNVTYLASADTQFNQTEAPFTSNGCVEIGYQVNSNRKMAINIDSTNASPECQSNGSGGGDDDDGDNDDGDNDDGGDDNEAKGLVESFPSGLVGDWVIGGVTYTANANTQFEQQHGAFAVNTCVEVEFQRNGTSNTATQIESKEPQECSGGGDNDDSDDDDGNDGDDDDDNDLKVYSLVESLPASLIGDWVIGGVTYTADASTRFEQEHGAFAVGTCVEIEYLPTSNQALKIESEHNYKCNGGSGGSGESYSQTTGVVESYPSALIGTWMIDGISYTASASTRFEQEHGPFFAGACVEIKYTSSDNGAIEIETKEGVNCGTTSSQDGSSSSSNSRSKFYGLIETLPDGLVGTWTVGGTNFDATSSTQFEQEHGSFVPGSCVEITYTTANNVNSATEIESEDGYHCSGASSTNQIYGTVDSFPAGLYGTWMISGISYVASPSTRLEQEDGAFATGNCVKVRYYTENGVNQATKIESEDDSCGNGSGGSSGSSNNSNNKVYATIDSLPESPYVGTWQIGGLTYEAIAATQFEQEHGSFAVGSCVEAKYSTSNSNQTLIEVETENSYKCGSNGQSQFTIYGTVETMPTAADRTGTWQISGVAYQANASTRFEQEYGFFAVGSYVEVKYQMDGQTTTALSIETHVAPGSGLQTEIGTLESHDVNDDWNDWVIGGVTYKADSAIDVGLGEQAPQVGEKVSFNSYDNNGTRYLTTVNRTGQYELFLPAITSSGQ